MAFVRVNPGDLIQAVNLDQIIDALDGAASKGQPIALTALNDAINYALTVQNDEVTNSRALLVLKSDGTQLVRVDASGVTLGSPLNLPTGSVTSAAILDGTITSADIGAGQVATANIASGAVGTAQLADSGVTSAKIADGTITSADIGAQQVATSNIANGAVGTGQLASGAVWPANLVNGAAQAFLGNYQAAPTFSTTTVNSWVATPVTVTVTTGTYGVAWVRLEASMTLNHTVAGGLAYMGFGIDGSPTNVGAINWPGANFAVPWTGVFYMQPAAGNHTFTIYVYNVTAGTLAINAVSYATLWVNEQRR